MTIHYRDDDDGKPVMLYDKAERNEASINAELRGKRCGHGKWKPALAEIVTVRASGPNSGCWERHSAHKQAGHESGDVVIGVEPTVVALTPLVCQKLEEKLLLEVTPNQIDAHKQKVVRRQQEAVAAFKERCRQDYIRVVGVEAGFEEAYPSIRAQRVIDARREAGFNLSAA